MRSSKKKKINSISQSQLVLINVTQKPGALQLSVQINMRLQYKIELCVQNNKYLEMSKFL